MGIQSDSACPADIVTRQQNNLGQQACDCDWLLMFCGVDRLTECYSHNACFEALKQFAQNTFSSALTNGHMLKRMLTAMQTQHILTEQLRESKDCPQDTPETQRYNQACHKIYTSSLKTSTSLSCGHSEWPSFLK